MTGPLAARGPDLVFGLGIEDTCVYPADRARPPLDEHDLTGHNQQWDHDLQLAADLGATSLRYGASWPLAHTGWGRFDWCQLDRAVGRADELGLSPVIDLVHYGTPAWLPASFAEPAYPDAIEEFATALVSRYRGQLAGLTPLNEPLTTASFCGLRGVWPPYLHGWEGWVKVVVPMALGIVRTAAATRRMAPELTIVHVEAATLVTAAEPATQEHARLLTDIGWLPTDLALGRVTADHPMHAWLLTNGASASDLEWLVRHGGVPDVIGVNYYPDLTPRRVMSGPDGPVQVAHNRWKEGLVDAVNGFAERYKLPLAITETSIEGDDAMRTRWLVDSVEACRRLRAGGTDLRGFTWWPMFDFIDWSWAAGGANVEEFAVARSEPDGTLQIGPGAPLGNPELGKAAFLRRMGLIRLEESADGALRRLATPAAAVFQRLATGTEAQP